ncbi:MAG: hypothetical protein J2P45_26520 [Candidatus Dormibacteraeota bacterium]|nr:hypothetical protein [Candidatus Dormibacteraeota bacterium]
MRTLLILAAVAFTACAQAGRQGGGGLAAPSSPGPSSPALAEVRSAAAGAWTGADAVRMTLSGASVFGGPTRADVLGQFDFRTLRGAMTVRPAGRPPNGVVFAANSFYLQVRSPAGLLPPGRSWIRADLSNPAAINRNYPQLIAQAEGVNPGMALAEVSWGATAAVAAGRDRLGGQSAVRYELTIDLQRALRRAGGPARLAFGLALENQITARAGPKRVSREAALTRARAWVTDAGQLVGLQLRPSGAGVGVVSLTLGASGTSVQSGPPPAHLVADISTLSPFGERENQNGGDSDGA